MLFLRFEARICWIVWCWLNALLMFLSLYSPVFFFMLLLSLSMLRLSITFRILHSDFLRVLTESSNPKSGKPQDQDEVRKFSFLGKGGTPIRGRSEKFHFERGLPYQGGYIIFQRMVDTPLHSMTSCRNVCVSIQGRHSYLGVLSLPMLLLFHPQLIV